MSFGLASNIDRGSHSVLHAQQFKDLSLKLLLIWELGLSDERQAPQVARPVQAPKLSREVKRGHLQD